MEDLFNLGVKAIIRNKESNILLFKLNNRELSIVKGWAGDDRYDIPGGRVKRDSNAMETLEIEVYEETGRKIINTKFLMAVASNLRLKNEFYGDIGLILFVYEVEIDDGDIVLNPENDSYQWVSSADAAAKLSTKYPTEFCEKIKSL